MRKRSIIATSPDWGCAKVLNLELVEIDLIYLGTVLAAMREAEYPDECCTPAGALLFSLFFTADQFSRAGIGGSSDDEKEE